MHNLHCTHCGANLTPKDLEQPHCPYCRNVLPHHARAAQQVEVVKQMMADQNGNGIPDAFEPMVRGAYPPGKVPGQPWTAMNTAPVQSALKTSLILFFVIGGVIALVTVGVVVAMFFLFV
jgi:hypothetical protein